MRLPRPIGNLLLAAAALIALVGAAELTLQLVMPIVYRPRITKIDPLVGWYHRPSVSTVSVLEGHKYRESYNTHGYRAPEHSYDRASGFRRIVFLGDSFVDGSEVGDEELFTWHLQQDLPQADVINLGVYAYSTAQETITLEHVGVRYHPDLVVLLTISNDFPGNAVNLSYFGPSPRFLLDKDSLRFEGTTSRPARAAFRASNLPAPAMSFLHEHSLVYYFLNHFIYQRLISQRIEALLNEQIRALTRAEQVELYRRLVSRMRRLCDDRGVGFLVVFGYARSELQPDRDSPNTDVLRALAADGVPTIDLYDALRDAELSPGPSLYYRENIHWNARGHRFVADALRPTLESWLRDHDRSTRPTTEGIGPGTTSSNAMNAINAAGPHTS